ncbi:MAG TPA: PQQ-dependent sugar dehydrogenase [Pyrinomonadaceae bacterium]|jgi:glucose/arabinose dehydrogenase|nr:PQQ-dependent sugar dehydrogenase [Pyrinomonadaceae bacterium]
MKHILRRVLRTALCLLSAALFTALISPWAFGQSGFSRKIITFNSPCDVPFEHPTTLALRPDGRLFVGQQNGMIFMLTLDAQLNVASVKCIPTIYDRDKVNHRLVTGMAFGSYFFAAGSPSYIGPDLYVSHSDGRFYDDNIDIHSGTVTKLVGSDYLTGVDIAANLPRSRADHAPNGLAFGPDGMLYLAIGGNTNAGLPSQFFRWLDEMPLGAGVLKIEPTPGGAVSLYATGLRNPYDLVWHSNGNLYVNDNGANGGLGNRPLQGCGDDGTDPGTTHDELNRILAGRYYGHPNPSRGECIFNGGRNFVAPMYQYSDLGSSSDGIAEYTATLIPGFHGNLFTTNFSAPAPRKIMRLVLSADGKQVTSALPFASEYDYLNPLDVVISDDGTTLFIAEYGGNRISALRWQSPTAGS